ncbi:hypothetical protein [Acinetobacter sp. WZC-1]|uniref:hypothetical protein n=1 Tax=Acinetobacter sp. WZC-1 TaxID=3459034 RepID=UPI00403D9C04
MPLHTIQRLLHIRTGKNQQVMRNIARLWDIGQQAQSHQDILDALHPWMESKHLYFYNNLPRLLVMGGVLTGLFGWLIHDYLPYPLSLLAGLLCCFLAYLMYESDDPIEEVILFLEQRMMMLRYNLQFNRTPGHLSATSSPLLVLSRLKQAFPLFSKGNVSNDMLQFASGCWHDGTTEHQLMLFQYRYVNELAIHTTSHTRQRIRQTQRDQWGAFIFQMPALGIAASNKHDAFIAPYTQRWQTSDILANQQLHIFGLDPHQLARTISPSLTLKLSDFFQQYSGELIYHFQENILCYIGDQDLLRMSGKKREIRDISMLRGHLRTLTLPEYEQFRQSMLNLIS